MIDIKAYEEVQIVEGYTGILNDKQIRYLAKFNNIITPYNAGGVRNLENGVGCLSFGASSFGYDFSLSPELYLKINRTGEVINVKAFNLTEHAEPMEIHEDSYGKFVIIPPHGFVLGRTNETVNMPDDVLALCFDKSTYARVGGVQTNITPLEPGWKGTITLEIRNTLPDYTRLYVNEGIIQAIFLKGLRPGITYSDKQGKYQDQKAVTGAKV